MSAHRTAFVYCDECGDSPHGDQDERTITEARSECRSLGWHRRRNGDDVCADCWDTPVTGEQAQP